MRILLRLIALLVPPSERSRWREEWLAEIEHGGWRMLTGALPDACAMRMVAPGRPANRTWTSAWRTDLKQTLRSLARSPWHVAVVSVCLGRPGDITRMVVKQALSLIAIGLLAGGVLGAPILIWLGKVFRHADALDPVALLGPIVALISAAAAAAWLPARRASRTDPCAALRSE
ncbi:MAG TPA: FtsX-like permease family protein [Vicinamibacterales bacterium]